MRVLLAALACTIALGGCNGEDSGNDCPVEGAPMLEVGVPDPITFLDFEPLVSGGDIPLSSNGQTFLAVQVAVRASNLGDFVRIGMNVTYTPTMGDPKVAVKDDSDEERLFCRADGMLYLVPVVVSSEMLGSDLEIQDQTVDVSVTVTDREDRTVTASTSGVLRRL